MTNTNPDLDRTVAEWMGWRKPTLKPDGLAWIVDGKVRTVGDRGFESDSFSTDHNACALVKARLVERGWNLMVVQNRDGAWAEVSRCENGAGWVVHNSERLDENLIYAPTEPEAIALLVVKVAEWEKEHGNG